MKKLVTAVATTLAAVTLASCGGKVSTTTTLSSKVDSAAYALGINNGSMFKQQFEMSPDTVNVDKFLEGFLKGITSNQDPAYSQGLSMGGQFKDWIAGFPGEKLDPNKLAVGLAAAIKDKDMKMTAEEAQAFFTEYIEEVQKAEAQKEIDADNKFIEELKGDAAVQTTASGLMYKITEEGSGIKPAATDTVVIHYTGYQVGKQDEPFDSSVERGEPARFALDQVIPGWTEGLQLMPAGSKFTLYIPGNLAYGERSGNQTGRPQGLLIFDCELIEVLPNTAAAATTEE